MKKETKKAIEISMKSLIVKPLHEKWMIQKYNYTNSSEGMDVCLKGWRLTGIFNAVEEGFDGLANLYHFDIFFLAVSDSLEEVDKISLKKKRQGTSFQALMGTIKNRILKVKMKTIKNRFNKLMWSHFDK